MSELEKSKIYFASDFHLGVPDYQTSLDRERKIVDWLECIRKDAMAIYLVGDIFDFWFEYKHAVPKGFVRLQGKIAELSDSGIQIHLFTGNHDMWIFDYLPKELGATLHRKPIRISLFDKNFLIGHGDGLGPGDKSYKLLKKVFSNRFCQWSFARLHPNFGIWLANHFSKTSRAKTGKEDEKFLGLDNEWLVQYAHEVLQTEEIHYFIFGHRHLPLNIPLTDQSVYYNLGDWLSYQSYLVVDQHGAQLKRWSEGDEPEKNHSST